LAIFSQKAVSADIIPNSAVGIFSHLIIIIYSLFAIFRLKKKCMEILLINRQ
jgi:hypothetical protein